MCHAPVDQPVEQTEVAGEQAGPFPLHGMLEDGGTLAGFARDLTRLATEKKKPNGERLREYRDSNLPSLEQQLFSTEPIYKNLETALLTDGLSEMQESLGKDNAEVQKVLQGTSSQASSTYPAVLLVFTT